MCEWIINRKVLIGLAIITTVIIISVILTLNSVEQASNKKEEYVMMRYPELPRVVNTELDQLYLKKSFTVNRWEIDESQKNITLYVIFMTAAQIDELQNKQVGEWTVTAVPDTEMMKEIEIVRAEMSQLEKDPEMQLATYSMAIGNGQIKIFVYLYNYTPANQELLKNGLRGWNVDGGPVSTPPPSPTVPVR